MAEESDGSCVANEKRTRGRERERNKWTEKMREESVSETHSRRLVYILTGGSSTER